MYHPDFGSWSTLVNLPYKSHEDAYGDRCFFYGGGKLMLFYIPWGMVCSLLFYRFFSFVTSSNYAKLLSPMIKESGIKEPSNLSILLLTQHSYYNHIQSIELGDLKYFGLQHCDSVAYHRGKVWALARVQPGGDAKLVGLDVRKNVWQRVVNEPSTINVSQ